MAEYTEDVMPSEREGFEEAVGRGDLETPKEKFLRAIFGSGALMEEQTGTSKGFVGPIMFDTPIGVGHPGIAANTVTALAQIWIKGHLPAAEIEEISTLASAVIGDQIKATKWLSEPNIATNNKAPIDLIGEKDGYEHVKNLLLRIEYGALA